MSSLLRTENGLAAGIFVVKCTGRGLVVKRPGVLSKVQMLNLVLGMGVFSLLPNNGSCRKLQKGCTAVFRCLSVSLCWSRITSGGGSISLALELCICLLLLCVFFSDWRACHQARTIKRSEKKGAQHGCHQKRSSESVLEITMDTDVHSHSRLAIVKFAYGKVCTCFPASRDLVSMIEGKGSCLICLKLAGSACR